MSTKFPGGVISKTAPTVVGPVGGEGGSAPGVWTLDQAEWYISQGLWPKPILPKQLWSWGYYPFGQLGLGNTNAYSSPKQVGALTNWSSVSCGSYFTVSIKTDGTLWSWGYNYTGQLGLGNTTSYSSPKQVGALTNWLSVSCGYFHTVSIKTDGTLWSWGRNNSGQLGLGNTTNYSSPKQVGALTSWTKLFKGSTTQSTLAIKSS